MVLIVLAIILTALLLSEQDVCSLKLIRILLLLTFIDVGRALSTWLASRLPAPQAEPDETATCG